MGGHDFLDHMPFRMTCVMIAYVLREVMLCCRKCLMGGHVLVGTCLQDGISYNMLCFTERHVLRVGIIGGYVLLSGQHAIQGRKIIVIIEVHCYSTSTQTHTCTHTICCSFPPLTLNLSM